MIAISMGLFGVRNDIWDLLCVYLSFEQRVPLVLEVCRPERIRRIY